MLKFHLYDKPIFVGFEHLDQEMLDQQYLQAHQRLMETAPYEEFDRLSNYCIKQHQRLRELVKTHTTHAYRNVRGLTLCEILTSNKPTGPEDIAAVAVSVCWHNEPNFSKKLGRKYSFRNAVKQLDMETLIGTTERNAVKAARRELWQQFFAETNWR